MPGVSPSAATGGDISKQIGDAAKPSQAQAGAEVQASTGALNSAAAATAPNASDAAKTASGNTPPPAPAPRAGGAGTASANADPNNPAH